MKLWHRLSLKIPSPFAEVIKIRTLDGWGEDFAAYQEKIPGVFALIGGNGEEGAPDLHHDTF